MNNNYLNFLLESNQILIKNEHYSYSIIDSKFGGIRSRGRLFLNGLMSSYCEEEKYKESRTAFETAYVSREPLGRFLSKLIRKVTRL